MSEIERMNKEPPKTPYALLTKAAIIHLTASFKLSTKVIVLIGHDGLRERRKWGGGGKGRKGQREEKVNLHYCIISLSKSSSNTPLEKLKLFLSFNILVWKANNKTVNDSDIRNLTNIPNSLNF